MTGNNQPGFIPNLKQHNTFVPTRDNLTNTNGKFQGLITLVGRIKNSSVGQLSFVVHSYGLPLNRLGTFTFLNNFIPQAAFCFIKTRSKAFYGRLSCGFRSEEHTSELQSRENLVCRLLLEK